VIYGGGDAAGADRARLPRIKQVDLRRAFLTTIFELDVGGVKQRVIPRDYQLDPIKDQAASCRFPCA